MKLRLESIEDTELFGAALWRALPRQCLVFLRGDLGAGKTSLVRSILRAAGYQGVVKSPTYTLVEEYHLNDRDLLHFDLYRLKDPEELEWIGMDDYLRQQALCFIEWPEMGAGFLPPADIELMLAVVDQSREVEIRVLSGNLANKVNLNWKNKDILL